MISQSIQDYIGDDLSFPLKGINTIDILGIYVTGSMVLDDFQQGKSDLDLIIVCTRFTGQLTVKDMRKVHWQVLRQFTGITLNGYYITLDHLKERSEDNVFYFEGKKLTEGPFYMSPVVLYELKQSGYCLSGAPVHSLPIVIDRYELETFLYHNIGHYWRKWVSVFSIKRSMALFLFPGITEWILLGMARQIATLKTGMILSKTAAGDFCRQLLPPGYQQIMQLAISIRKSNRSSFFGKKYFLQPSLKRSRDTIACGLYLITVFKEDYRSGSIMASRKKR